MKPYVAIFSLLVVFGVPCGVLFSESPNENSNGDDKLPYNVPLPDGSIPPVFIERQTGPRYEVSVAKHVNIPEKVEIVDVLSAMNELIRQPLDKSETEWREELGSRFDRNPRSYQVQKWHRSIQAMTENDEGDIEVTVRASLTLKTEEGLRIAAGTTTEVYLLLPKGKLELIERKPHRVRAMVGL